MYSLLSVVIGLCLGFSPLGNSRILRIFIMSVTGG